VSYLRDIAVFVRVVEQKGFAAAGRALGLTAPSVSKQIARLEAEIGVALLHRTTHNLFLTDAGQEFYERCVKGLAELEQARAVALSFNDELRGRLRVHATLAVGQALIAPAVIDFIAAHPGIQIDLEMGSMPVNPMEVQVDIAIRTKGPRETSPGHVSIGRRILGSVRHVLVASPEYVARAGSPQTAEDIQSKDCLLYLTYSTFTEGWLFHNGRQEVTIRIGEPLLRSNNWLAVRDAAIAGRGLARLPEFTVRQDLAEGRLVALLEDQIRSDLQVQAVFPKTRRMPAKIRLLLDFLSHRLAAAASRHQETAAAAAACQAEAGSDTRFRERQAGRPQSRHERRPRPA